MDLLYVILAMIAVGAVIGALAGPIWKNVRPIGVSGDYSVAILTAVAIGLLDFFVIPRMGFSDTMKWLGVAIEPALGALAALWIVRKVKK